MSLSLTEKLDSFVRKHNDRQLLVLPVAIFLIAILIIAFTLATTGAPVKLGMEFKGGTMISLTTDTPAAALKEKYSAYPLTDVRQTGSRTVIQFGPLSNEEQLSLTQDVTDTYQNVEIRQIGPVYGTDLQKQAIKAVIFSFIGMSLVVFIIFRIFIPSLAIVLAAFCDIVIAVAFMNVAGIELSLGTVAALLMLIGYSVDSDILLTTRVLKRRGEVEENITNAMGTGITMTTTTLAALIVLYVVTTYSYLIIPSFSQINLLSDISIVLIFGLLADIINTWLTNVSILRWYVKREGTKGARRRRA
ncbi:preprotein translocase subunit SecF [Methanomethylovorans hollandica DSM 15978]|jgi:preprotein translocase subunit SecF|uniref:Protein-export membrane protein SecF n=1 Tax=Methanomethylovorans hollandica (strain DSM 15978 / NBRC 107637 / DMS1) TaxID=867904 RepID=L0L1H3_METHD|nr:protein translocase subunit SecF [Methanomethylovorans hollandica]AGB50243.1 preprotein translocase subunit SecF [Methanomethylovorans hollandica DSM 15978]